MKVALLHDYLNQFGGAERVLETFLEIFPEADIYTLFYLKNKELALFEKNIKKTSFLDFPIVARNHQFFIPLLPLASNSLKIPNSYDLIISDSAGFGKGFSTPKGVFHLSYVHTPLRYAWEFNGYFKNFFLKTFGKIPAASLRGWDFRAAKNPDKIVVPSKFIKDKVSNFYGLSSKVIHPPIDWGLINSFKNKNDKRENFYLAAGRLIGYKRFDLILDAFKENGLPLKIVGSGRELARLKNKAKESKNIDFLGFVSRPELYHLYNSAKGFIFPQVEDFGMVAAEAEAAGLPVIGLKSGGALEIIENQKTGLFFENQTVESLNSTIKIFENMVFDHGYIRELAKRFSKERFKKEILEILPEGMISTLK